MNINVLIHVYIRTYRACVCTRNISRHVLNELVYVIHNVLYTQGRLYTHDTQRMARYAINYRNTNGLNFILTRVYIIVPTYTHIYVHSK